MSTIYNIAKKAYDLDAPFLSEADEIFAKMIAQDCIITIQLHMPRNGVNSPENTISKQHIKYIAERYGIELPLPKEAYIDRV